MKVTFIRPNLYDDRSSDAMEPLCFAILKSLTPDTIETSFFDERLEPLPLDEVTDLVAITVETYTARRAYQIARDYRRRGIKVIMGGYHPTFLPDEVLEYADSIVKGDAEGVWGRVLEDAQAGRLEKVYQSAQFPELTNAMPDRSIFKGKKYAPMGLVQYSRGCKFNCSFCSIRAFYGNNLRQRPVAAVVEDIRRSGKRHIFLVDDNIFVDVDKARELFEALTPLKISWSCQVSIDIARDKNLVALMARSGCISALIGFESLEPESLRDIKKGWNVKWQSYDEAIAVFQDVGIMIYGTFIFGCEHDSVASFDSTVAFAIRHKLLLANFNPLTPMPGAPLFDRMQREGRLLHDRWWLDPDFKYGDATMRPTNMTPDELTQGCFAARRKFNTLGSIFGRMLDLRTNFRTPYRMGIFLLANFVSRQEILRKQQRGLGKSESMRLADRTVRGVG
ncbi:MAG: B12-binding domain-containing radical SAM protein [Gammaproteobacteria bacterium]|nr:B12-binding domain-containing radical SAM protein [Gammaproteobacteria bacterium]